jgi:hypothetical protein
MNARTVILIGFILTVTPGVPPADRPRSSESCDKEHIFLSALFIKRVRISRNIVPSLILASLRGFCLLISGKHTVGISAKETDRVLYPVLFMVFVWSTLPENEVDIEYCRDMCKKTLSVLPGGSAEADATFVRSFDTQK